MIFRLHLLLSLLLSPEHNYRDRPLFFGGGKGGGRKSGEVFLSSIPRMPLCPPFDRLKFFFFFFLRRMFHHRRARPLSSPPSLPPSHKSASCHDGVAFIMRLRFLWAWPAPSSWGTLLVTLGPLPARRWETGEGQEMSAASPPVLPPSLANKSVCHKAPLKPQCTWAQSGSHPL